MSNGGGTELWVSSSRAYQQAKEAEDMAQAYAASMQQQQQQQQQQQLLYQRGASHRSASAGPGMHGVPQADAHAGLGAASTPAPTQTPTGATTQALHTAHAFQQPQQRYPSASWWEASSLNLIQHPHSPPPVPAKPSRNRRYTSILFHCVAAVHAVLYIVAVGLNSWVLEDLQDNPLLGPGVAALQRIGATSAFDMANNYQYWRLLVSPFLGAGVLHVWTNITAITTYSVFLANDIPLWQIALIYLTAGISSVTTSANIGSRFITAAGSGPAFGMMGAACVLLLAQFRRLRNHWLSLLLMVFSLALNCFVGATPFVDNSGNTAGFVTGLMGCSGFLLLRKAPGRFRTELWVQVAAMLLLSCAVVIPVLGIIGLNTGLPLKGCCDAWVCAPSPWWDCSAAYAWPDTCSFLTYNNGTVLLSCPKGGSTLIPASLLDYGHAPASVLDALCQSFCTIDT